MRQRGRPSGFSVVCRVATALAVIAVLCACVTNQAAAPSGNILRNPGFETAGPGVPDWTPESRAAAKGTVAVVEERSHKGRALRLQPNNRNAPWDIANGPLAAGQGFPVDAFRGKRMRFSAWMGADGGATAVVAIYALYGNGRLVDSRLNQPSAPGPLTYHEGTFVVPSDKGVKYLILNCTAEGTAGSAYFDDVTLEVATADSAQRADPGPALSGTIRVRANEVVRTIPRTIYGTNLEWIWDGQGAWHERTQSLDPELIRLTKEAGFTLLRFPGGVFADAYHWREGIGPQSNRPLSTHTGGPEKSRHSFGTDEALAFASATGGELLITVNAGSGTPAEAADWVRYVNGNAGGAPRVLYWEIGNELYVPQFASIPPEEYARRLLAFASAMRAADPRIRIGAIADDNFGTFRHAYPDWTAKVLAQAAPAIDFLAVHNAYAPVLERDQGLDGRTVYSAMLAAPAHIKANLAAVGRRLDGLATADRDRIRLAITEWGPLFQITPRDRFVDHVKTLGSALLVASTLKALIESPKVEVANAFKLSDQLFMGWIGKRNGLWTPKAPYYAFQLFAQHFGSVLVQSEADGPTYSAPAAGWVPATPDAPYLEAIASVNEARSAAYVIAINKHFDRALTVTLTLDGIVPARGTVWRLSGTAVDANTGTELFRAPGISWAKQATVEPGSRFEQGGPGEVTVEREDLKQVGSTFTYTLPPHSVTAFELVAAARGGR